MKVTILGAGGRMGAALVRAITQTPALTLCGAVERNGHPSVGMDAGTCAGLAPLGVSVTDDLEAGVKSSDVVVDFTIHSLVPATLEVAVKHEVACVIGTTGLNDGERKSVETAAAHIPIVWAPNMSLGVNLLMHLVQRAASVLGMDYDAEIVEMHHRHKLDAPSGTALGLLEAVAEGRGQNSAEAVQHGRKGITGERPRGQIGCHALRGGDVIGDHTVIFATDGERMELTHKASSRDCFAHGALRAALWLKNRSAGLYNMVDVLELASAGQA